MASANKSNQITSGEYSSLYHINSEHSGSNAYIFRPASVVMNITSDSTLTRHSSQPFSGVVLFSGNLSASINFPSVTYAQLNKRCIVSFLVATAENHYVVSVLNSGNTTLFSIPESVAGSATTHVIPANSITSLPVMLEQPYAIQALTNATIEIIEQTPHAVIGFPAIRTVNIQEGNIFYCNPYFVRVTSGDVKMFFAN